MKSRRPSKPASLSKQFLPLRLVLEASEQKAAEDLDRPPRKSPKGSAPKLVTPPPLGLPDTEVRSRLLGMLRSGRRLACVWSGLTIRDSDHIGYAMGGRSGGMPHLWNQMPINPHIRSLQGDALATDTLLNRSRERIIGWWQEVYLEHPFRGRFYDEVGQVLIPGLVFGIGYDEEPDLERVFEAFRERHTILRAGQGIAGWSPYEMRSRVREGCPGDGRVGGSL